VVNSLVTLAMAASTWEQVMAIVILMTNAMEALYVDGVETPIVTIYVMIMASVLTIVLLNMPALKLAHRLQLL
jgi:hypothetical protein